MRVKSPKPAFCVTKDGKLVEFGRYSDTAQAEQSVPRGAIYLSTELLRQLSLGRIGFPELDGRTNLDLAVAAVRITHRGPARNALEVAVAILEGRYPKKLKFPVVVETDPEIFADELCKSINIDTFSLEDLPRYVRLFFPKASAALKEEIAEAMRRRKSGTG